MDVDIRKNMLSFFIKILKDNQLFFVKLILATFVLSSIFSILIEPRYNSRISFYVTKNDAGSGIGSFDLSQLMLSGSPVVNSHDFNIIDIIESNDIYESLLYNQFESINSNLIDFWNIKPFSIFNNDESNQYRIITNIAIKKLKSRVSFNENRKSGLISISVNLENKSLSKEFIEAFYARMSDLLIEVNSKKMQDKVNYYNQITTKYKSNLDSKENELIEFLVTNKNIQNSEVLKAERNRIERQVNILSTTYYSLLTELEVSKVNQSDSLPLLVILDAPKEAHKKSYPPRKLIVVASIIVAVFIGLFYKILINNSLKKELRDFIEQ